MIERYRPISDAEIALGAAINGLRAAQANIDMAERHEALFPAHEAVTWRTNKQVVAESLAMAEEARAGLKRDRGAR